MLLFPHLGHTSMMVTMLRFVNTIFVDVGVGANRQKFLIEEGTNKTHFLQERYENASNVGINNNLQTETFSNHIHRNIYQNLSGQDSNRNLNNKKQEKGRKILLIQMFKQNRS